MQCYACNNDAEVTVNYLVATRFQMSDPLCNRCLGEATKDGDYEEYDIEIKLV